MTEQTASTTGTEETNNEQGTEAAKEFQAITSQEDFDKAIQARIARERAKIPTDYEQLKADAAELAQIRDAQKTEAEKLQEERDKARQDLETERSARIRAEVAATKGIPAALLVGSTQEELEKSADALIAFKGEQPKPSAAPFVEGTNKVTAETDLVGAIAQATKDRNFPLVATLKAQEAALKAKKG